MSRSIVDIDYHKNLFYVTENIYKFLNEQGLFEKYKETFLKFVAQILEKNTLKKTNAI